MTNYSEEWKNLYDDITPQKLSFPKKFKDVDGLERLVILRCLRPDKVVPAVQVGQFYCF